MVSPLSGAASSPWKWIKSRFCLARILPGNFQTCWNARPKFKPSIHDLVADQDGAGGVAVVGSGHGLVLHPVEQVRHQHRRLPTMAYGSIRFQNHNSIQLQIQEIPILESQLPLEIVYLGIFSVSRRFSGNSWLTKQRKVAVAVSGHGLALHPVEQVRHQHRSLPTRVYPSIYLT